MKYIDSLSQLNDILTKYKTIILLFIDPAPLPPSSSLIKLFSNHIIPQTLPEYFYIIQNPNAELYTIFKVYEFPVVFLLKQSVDNILYSFIGCNQERTIEAMNLLCDEIGQKRPTKRLKQKVIYCPAKH